MPSLPAAIAPVFDSSAALFFAPASSQSTQTRPPRLLDQLRAELRTRHYAIRTEQVYVDWARRFILHHGKRHPR